MDGRFRRKKKLKVSEKFEKLGTLAFSAISYILCRYLWTIYAYPLLTPPSFV